MKSVLFAALLGCFVVPGLAQRDMFRFTDSQGRCWQCSPSSSCVPCPISQVPNNPIQRDPFEADLTLPTTCSTAEITNRCQDVNLRGILYPSVESRNFYQCVNQAGVWTAVLMDCQCGALFDYRNQRCEFPWTWEPWCANLNIPITVVPCDDELTSTTPIDDTTTTSLTTTTAVTTSSPCSCIPWFPCWCNPCFMMPCGSCNGCRG